MKKIDEDYIRNLPHIQPDNGVFSITYRINGSLPNSVIDHYEEEYEKQRNSPGKNTQSGELFFDIIDNYLDNSAKQNLLKSDTLAGIVADSLKFYENKYFQLIAYCIMPNHVHIIVNKNKYPKSSLTAIFGSIKGFSSYKINKELNRVGKFWNSEIYDHLIRSRGELVTQIKYILNNPVKAGLVNDWKEWKYSYIIDGYLDI
jgi:REP element-mobilizing transposase RayT